MRFPTVLISLLLLSPAFAENAPAPDGDPSLLTLEKIFTGEDFNGEDGPDVRWLDDGRRYTVLEPSESVEDRQDVVRYDAETGRREVLAEARQLVAPGHTEPLEIDGYALSPGGDRLLVYTNAERVWRRKSRGDYWTLELKTGQLARLGGDAAPSTLMFATSSPDGRKVAYVRERNLYVESAAGGEIVRLTDDGSETVINGTFDWVYEEEFSLYDGFRWSPDSRRIAYWQLDTSGTGTFHLIDNTAGLYPELKTFRYPKAGTTNSSCRIGVVDAGGGPTTWLADYDDPRQHYLARMEWAESSREIVVQHFNRPQNALTLLLGDVDSGRYRTIHVERDEAWIEAVDEWEWLDGGRRLLWVSESDGWRHAYRIEHGGGKPKLLTPGEYDVISLEAVDEKGGWLYFMASPENPGERYLYRAPLDGSGAAQRVTPAAATGYHAYDIAPGAAWAVHTFSSFGRPPVVELVRLPGHTSRRVLVSNAELTERVAQLRRGDHRFFRVAIGDGVELDGWEMRPPDFDPAKKYPVLFYVYGEPWGQTVQDAWRGKRYLWHLLLTQQGYLVMSVDNRGTKAPRGRAWRKSIYRQIGVLSSEDQAAAARKIFEQDYVDASRVGIWGWSGGGSMTLNMLLRYPELYHTGLSVAPVPDQRYYDTIYQERYQGLPEEGSDVYEQGSPITFAENLEGNLLLVHGTGDDNVHYQGMEALINKLVAANKPFTMMAYPNRSHGISEGEGTTRHLYELLTRFLKESLEPGGRSTEPPASPPPGRQSSS